MKKGIEDLQAELLEAKAERSRLARLYNPKASRNHYSTEINALICRIRNLHTNINQARQRQRKETP